MRTHPDPNTRPPLVKATAGAVLIGTCGRLLLQQRDNVPDIDNPGQIGLFGGHVEPGEDFRTCVAREVAEETGHDRPPSDFTLISDLRVDDRRRGEMAVTGFILRDVPTETLVITEGSLCALHVAEVGAHWQTMTPSTLFAIREACDVLGLAP